jgi:glucosylceramidase
MIRDKKGFPYLQMVLCVASILIFNIKVLALSATDTIQAESFSGQSGVTTETCSEGGQDVTSIQNGDYISFENVDFGSSGIQCFEARVASDGNGGFIELRLDSQTGTLVGTCEILPPTGSWQTWTNKACKVTGATGIHSLYLVFTGGVGTIPISKLFNLNWFKFHGTPTLDKANWRQTTNQAKGVLNNPITLSNASSSTPVIQINPDSMFQRVDGWGGAFNENGYHCISLLSPGLRDAVMKELFDPVSGCRFNYGRVPIGMSDFTVNKVYSLDELPAGVTTDYNMQYFSLKNDSLMNIAFVKAAMVANPNIMIYASPWTPPTWMKTNKSWEGGNNPTIVWNNQMLAAYALYFSKFVKGWKQAGISVNIVYPQNEPGFNTTTHPSCAWSGATLKSWVHDFLYPKFKADTISTQIWMGTFNGSYYSADIQPTLDDAEARTMITGIGVQRDGNNALFTASQNPYYISQHYHSMQTETNCWAGANSWNDAMNTFQQIWNHESANVNIYNMWNMILDADYNYVSWMTRAQNSMITITPASQTVKYNPEFYVMKHWSYYIRTGAVRVYNTNSNSNLRVMAFKNPDGTIILEVQNTSSATISPLIRVGTKEFTPALVASSVNTFNIGGTEPTGNWVPATAVRYMPPKKMGNSTEKGIIGIYDIKGRLIKVLDLTSAGLNTTGINWDRKNADGRKVSPGMYILKNHTAGSSIVRKVICR